jgi:SAM-dependent methyltransferase
MTSTWIGPRARLLAEYFDLSYPGPEPGELEFVLRRIGEGGEPALELGCGTGRMLVPLLERGIAAVGVDVSAHMLDRCRAKCAAQRLPVELHVQEMQKLELPARFGTIFMGSCGLGVVVSDEDAYATFHRAYEHLRPGGVVSFEIETTRRAARIADRPGLWSGNWHKASAGSVLTMRMTYRYDPSTHVRSSVMILERHVEGELQSTELHETALRFWDVGEISALLEEVGFVAVRATRVFHDDEPPGDGEWLVVRARKP